MRLRARGAGWVCAWGERRGRAAPAGSRLRGDPSASRRTPTRTLARQDAGSYGSMLELSWQGTKPIPMPDGTTRTFLADGDAVTLVGWAQGPTSRVSFGECTGLVLPATPYVAK